MSATTERRLVEPVRYEPPRVVDITREEYLRRTEGVNGGRAR
jgi:hypothetical protein